MQTRWPPVGVCRDCVVLLLRWAGLGFKVVLNGHGDNGAGRQMTPGPAVTQGILGTERPFLETELCSLCVCPHRTDTNNT